jgi:hypothetical protein
LRYWMRALAWAISCRKPLGWANQPKSIQLEDDHVVGLNLEAHYLARRMIMMAGEDR